MLAILTLSGCSADLDSNTGAHPAASPSPSVACPMVEGFELPPECIPYDPEAAMALNEMHRERMPLDAAAFAENERAIEHVLTALEAVRESGDIDVDAVTAALEEVGFTAPEVRGSDWQVLFGMSGPAGGCLFGDLTSDAVTVNTGGYILDGGCLAAQ